MPTRRFGVFDPETASALARAFEEAWQSLQQAGVELSHPVNAHRLREALAVRIITLAQEGERDVIRLTNGALASLVTQRPKSRGWKG